MNRPESNSRPTHLDAHASLLMESFARVTGKPFPGLDPTIVNPAERLFLADVAVLSHNTLSDPIFTYGNRLALIAFEVSLDALLKMPSRLSAEPLHRDAREQLLNEVHRNGYIDHYEGVRISSTGARFTIRDAVVWNIIDADGNPLGQAALFPFHA